MTTPIFIKLKLIILLIPIYSTLAYCQSKANDDPKWEFGTEVFLRYNTVKLNGLYVSRSINKNFDILLKTDWIAGIVRSDKREVDLTDPSNYSELELDKYAFYLSLKGNKNFKNNTRIYGTLGPYYRKYSYTFERGSLSSLPSSGFYKETDFQIKSLFGANIVVKELISLSIETPISWFTSIKRTNADVFQYGPSLSDTWSISIRLGLMF